MTSKKVHENRERAQSGRSKDPGRAIYDDEYYFEAVAGGDEYRETGGELVPRLLEVSLNLADLKPGHRVLDVGCGRGEIVLHSGMKGATAVGVDHSSSAIAVGKETLKKGGAGSALALADAINLPFKDEVFDRIFLLDIIEHLTPDSLSALYRETNRCLREDGIVVIHTPTPLEEMLLQSIYAAKRRKNIRRYTQLVHINVRSPRGVKRHIESHGFKIITRKEFPGLERITRRVRVPLPRLIRGLLVYLFGSTYGVASKTRADVSSR